MGSEKLMSYRQELGPEINVLSMDMSRIDAEVAGGSTEIREVEGIAVPHNFCVHGVKFHVLDVDGEAVAPAFRGRKDTE
jgi:FtsP/CotA-like multicopper oxidase with cupredoxin domain